MPRWPGSRRRSVGARRGVCEDRHDRCRVTTLSAMVMGKRRRHAKQASMWVATEDLPRTAAHTFYPKLNQILDKHDFDEYVEGPCQRFYADDVGRPGLPPERYFRLLQTPCDREVRRQTNFVREMVFTTGCYLVS